MHLTSFENAKRFENTYPTSQTDNIAEIGSQVVENQFSLRSLFSGINSYTGFDFTGGEGVDIILKSPYTLPSKDNSFTRVISSSCFEHAEFFWESFLEMARICTDNGLIYIQAPSNGKFHRYPVDCWRFYPDSGIALQNWARYKQMPITLLESFTSHQKEDCWNDFVAIFFKGDISRAPTNRIIDSFKDFKNGIVHGSPDIIHHSEETEDMIRRNFAANISSNSIQIQW